MIKKMIQMIMRRRPHLYTQSRVSQKQPRIKAFREEEEEEEED